MLKIKVLPGKANLSKSGLAALGLLFAAGPLAHAQQTAKLKSGQASLTTTALPVGSDSITAAYAGDSSYAASTSKAIIQKGWQGGQHHHADGQSRLHRLWAEGNSDSDCCGTIWRHGHRHSYFQDRKHGVGQRAIGEWQGQIHNSVYSGWRRQHYRELLGR